MTPFGQGREPLDASAWEVGEVCLVVPTGRPSELVEARVVAIEIQGRKGSIDLDGDADETTDEEWIGHRSALDCVIVEIGPESIRQGVIDARMIAKATP